MSELNYIIIDGLIKTGKTRLAEIIAQELNAKLILDNKENPFLTDFYKSFQDQVDAIGLKTQLIFLINRYSQQMTLKQKGLFHKATVCDYIFFRDGIYAHAILNDEELDLYKKLFGIFSENIITSDLVIYLQISFAEMIKRIKELGSEQERNMPAEYWREIYEAYNYFFFNYKSSPLLVVNMERVNLDSIEDIKHLLYEIKNHKKGTCYYAPA